MSNNSAANATDLIASPTQHVDPIMSGIEQMLHRLDEFESILNAANHADTAAVCANIAAIAGRSDEYRLIGQQIHAVELLVEQAEQAVKAAEERVDRADEELGTNSLGLKGLLLRGKKWATASVVQATAGGASTASSGTGASRLSSSAFGDSIRSSDQSVPAFSAAEFFVSNEQKHGE